MAHLFLDQEPNRPSPYTQTTRSATFIEQYEPGWGQVRIDDENTTSLVDVRLLPGVYAKGAQVGLVCGYDGRPIHATPPQTMADDATPIGVGTSGEYTIEAKTEAGEAKKDAAAALADSAQASNAAREANEAAKKAWNEASSARESIATVDSSARAAVQTANNAERAAGLTQAALDAAKEAQRLENEALKAATSTAQSKADMAAGKASQADSKAGQAQTAASIAQATADALYTQAENKVPNGSFEGGFQPWSSNFALGASHVMDIEDAWHGSKVISRTITSTNFHWVFLPFEQAVSTEPGRVWEARARVRTVGGAGTGYAGFRAYRADGKWMVPGTTVPGLVDGQWVTISYRYESTSAVVRVTPLIGVSAERGTIFQIDAIELRDVTEAVAAQKAADAAKTKADAAQSTADKAAGKASEAQTIAEVARAKADDLAKQAQEAMKTAQEAQTSADGKALVAYSTYQPATMRGQKIIWFKPGSVPMLYDGATWRSVQPGDGVVQALNIDKATVGELSGMRIKAGTASVDILIPGENARWTSSGLTIYHPLTPEQRQAGIKPTEWDKRATALNLTSDGARFISVADEAGTVTAYMSPQGEVSGRELTITGAAAVDSLKVGGLDLQEVISLKSSLAAYSV
ncbi:hypothetical protein QP786_07310, partial [Gleimia europaea]|nr:hypothetical protein [Gleimia europaea]